MIIGIAGGTGSGKSTFTNRLRDAFPDDVAVLYHDNYYKCQDDVPFEERKKVNYDHPDSLETDLMIQHLEAFRSTITVCTTVLTRPFTLSQRRSFWQKVSCCWKIPDSAT